MRKGKAMKPPAKKPVAEKPRRKGGAGPIDAEGFRNLVRAAAALNTSRVAR